MSAPAVIDPFAEVQAQTRRHRADHHCGAYTYQAGSLLGFVAAAVHATQIVEVGTALGYTALWLAHGSSRAHVWTIEMDPMHVQLARQNFDAADVGHRVKVLEGLAEDLVSGLERGGFDLAFFDGFEPSLSLFASLRELLRPGGVLVAGNLTLAVDDVAHELDDQRRWLTHSLGETGLCVKR